MENLAEIFVVLLLLGGTVMFLGLARLRRPGITPANRAETAHGLFEHFKGDWKKMRDNNDSN